MYRHLLCVYPYRVELGRSGFFPPLGLELVAAALEPHCESLDIVDLRRERGRTLDFVREDTDLVAFSVNWDVELDSVFEEIRSVPGNILTVVGGRCATHDPGRVLAACPNVDIVVRGDGEEVVDEIARGRPPSEINGISYRSNGRVVHGPARSVGRVRDDLRPNRTLRRSSYTMDLEGFRTGHTMDSVASSRGCPFNCVYCSFSMNPWGTKRSWSARSPEAVVREIGEIEADLVIFTDDNFTHDMDRVGRICDLVIERGIRKRYFVNARVEIAKRPDVLRKMERAGFSMLLLGIESTQDRTLRAMRKGFDTRGLREYFRVLGRSRMLLHGYFIIGNVGETREEMLSIPRFAHELGVDSLGLCILRNEPHSGIQALVDGTPGYHIDSKGYVYSDSLSTGQLRGLRRRLNRRFYTPGHVLHVLKKGMRNRLLTPGITARLPGHLLGRALEHLLGGRRRSGRDHPAR